MLEDVSNYNPIWCVRDTCSNRILGLGSIHAVFGKFDVGIHSEQLAFSTIDKMKAEAIRGQTTIMSYSVTHLWRYTLDHRCRQDLLNAYHQAMNYGDIFRAQFGMVGWVLLGTYLDSNLIEIHNRMRSVVAEMHEYDAKCSLIFLLPTWQSVSADSIKSLSLISLMSLIMLNNSC
jgi:hypothetical protein